MYARNTWGSSDAPVTAFISSSPLVCSEPTLRCPVGDAGVGGRVVGGAAQVNQPTDTWAAAQVVMPNHSSFAPAGRHARRA